MSGDRIKRAAQWFYQNVFRDEPIGQRTPPSQPSGRPQSKPAPRHRSLPPQLRAARSLEQGISGSYHRRETIFLQQAKLLADYEEVYPFQGNPQYYFTTYQSLTDPELRGYFSWRTQLRRGQTPPAPLSFLFLHIYELLNQVGIANAEEGYRKLCFLREQYATPENRLQSYLDRWIQDYVVYYDLNPNLLAATHQVIRDRSITVLEQVRYQDTAKVIAAVKTLAPKWLGRSKFYREHTQDMDIIIHRVLIQVAEHYDHCQKPMTEQFFGSRVTRQLDMFGGAVFANHIRRPSFEYALDERCIFRCKGNLWTLERHDPSHGAGDLENLMKTIDALLREAYSDRSQIQCALQTKWILRAIGKEIGILQQEKAEAEAAAKAEEAAKYAVAFDFSRLEQIRQAAAITRDKLIVEEEAEPEPAPEPDPMPEPEPKPEIAPVPEDTPLSKPEYRLLQCMLYGGDTGWVQAEGYLRSVLIDSINEKLYDTFLDTVLEETGPVEDYIDDLKGMVHP